MFKKGDRIELVRMGDDPCPIPSGERGTVRHVNEVRLFGGFTQVSVAWDSGRGLMLTIPPDRARVIADDEDEA